jgi:ketosteroid isomerase-like protein
MSDMRCQFAPILVLALSLPLAAQNPATPPLQEAPKTSTAPATVDRAYLQSIWDGWAGADLEKQSQFYAKGSGHLFFDVAPLKYSSWQEYRDGVAPSLKDAPKVTYALNDDIEIHPAGPVTWVAATLTMSGQSPQGEKETLYLRWTAVLEQQDGRWLITHEHVSAPAEPPPSQ